MKKIIPIILLSLLFVSCWKESPIENQTVIPSPTSQTPQEDVSSTVPSPTTQTDSSNTSNPESIQTTNSGASGLNSLTGGMNSTTVSTNPQTITGDFEGDFNDIYAKKGSVKCQIFSSQNRKMKLGEAFLQGDKVKTIIPSSSMDLPFTVITIIRDGYSYSWDDSKNGTKFKYQKNQTQDTDGKNTNFFQCVPATINETDFDIPKDIKFIEYSHSGPVK